MQININLHNKAGQIVRSGRIDPDHILDCAIVKYQGALYTYRGSSDVYAANFHEASEPMVIDSLIKDRQP